jgi:NTE family protein
MADAARDRPTIALVLSGGGARGAYEAGVLSWVLDDLPRRLGRPAHFDIVTGTSVGAVHACYMAARQGTGGAGARLAELWRGLTLDRVFPVGATDVWRVPWRLIGLGATALLPARGKALPERAGGLFDTSWLETLVAQHVDWAAIRHNVRSGALRALAVTATEIATGRSVVFIDGEQGSTGRWGHDPYTVARPTRILPPHALASAAIPLGGLRMNTPLAPALRLGADRVLVLSLRHPRTPDEEDVRAREVQVDFARPAYLAGKALNALLLDRIAADVERLRLFNAILARGMAAYGPSFLDRINEPIIEQRGVAYRVVRDCVLAPSRDLGELAAECLRHQPRSAGMRDWLSRGIVRYAGRGTLGEADLVSYLLFDRCYAEHLLALGRADAARAEDALVDFFSP